MAWIRSETLSKFSGIAHGFSNREFDDDLKEVARDFGLSAVLTLTQAHGADVLIAGDGFRRESGKRGDAIITSQNGLGIGVFTADCVPILLVDRSASYVAVVHAGWRGTFSQIAKNTLYEMNRNFGTDPSKIYAVLGPSIGRCCYEVGEDVASLFLGKFQDSDGYLFGKDNSKYMLDLKEANRLALLEEGIKDVEVMDICTGCDIDFHSYRRDGKRVGSQLSFIGLV